MPTQKGDPTEIVPGVTKALTTPGRWADLRTVRYDLVVTTVTPIAHSQGTVGNDAILMTERVLDLAEPAAEPEDVPCLTGNTLRHALREALCRMTLAVLDVELGSLTLPAQHFLLSGGALGKQAKTLDLDGYRRLVEAFPYLPLFGGGIGHALVPGKLEVGYGILLCRQNAWRVAALCPALGSTDLPDAQNLRERRQKTRHDSRRAALGQVINPQGDLGLPEGAKGEKPMQMIAGYEVVCAGARFLWQVGVQLATEVEHAALLCALVALSARGRLGAQGGTGHGRVLLRAVGESGEDRPLSEAIAVAEEAGAVAAAERMAGGYVARVRERRAEILDFLNGLK